MTMNSMDRTDIVQSTVDGFKVRCDHRMISLSESDLNLLKATLTQILDEYLDNSALQGEYNNGN